MLKPVINRRHRLGRLSHLNRLSHIIALRHIRTKSTNRFLSFSSGISLVGLTLGVAVLIVVTSVMNGFEHALTNRLLGVVPQIQIQSATPDPNWHRLATDIAKEDTNIIGFDGEMTLRGMIAIDGKLQGSVVNGIDPNQHAQVSILPHSMHAGSLSSLQPGAYHIVLGKALADKHQLKLGDQLSLMMLKSTDSSANNAMGLTPTFHQFTVSGIFAISEEVETWISYVALDDAAKIAGVDAYPTVIRFRLAEPLLAPISQAKMTNTVTSHASNSNANRQIVVWQQTHGEIHRTIGMQKTMMSLLLFLIIVVAGFNTIANLMMMIEDKQADIAILKTLGASPSFIQQTFIRQSLILAVMGIAMGGVLGVTISLNISQMSAWLDNTFALGLFDGYFVSSLPARIQLSDVLLIVLASLCVCVLAAWIPAHKAAAVQPAIALSRQ